MFDLLIKVLFGMGLFVVVRIIINTICPALLFRNIGDFDYSEILAFVITWLVLSFVKISLVLWLIPVFIFRCSTGKFGAPRGIFGGNMEALRETYRETHITKMLHLDALKFRYSGLCDYLKQLEDKERVLKYEVSEIYGKVTIDEFLNNKYLTKELKYKKEIYNTREEIGKILDKINSKRYFYLQDCSLNELAIRYALYVEKTKLKDYKSRKMIEDIAISKAIIKALKTQLPQKISLK